MTETSRISADSPPHGSHTPPVGDFGRIVDAINQCVLAVDATGRAVFANAAARKVLACAPDDDLAALAPEAMWDPTSLDLLLATAMPVAQETGQWEGELTLARSTDGTPRRMYVMAHAGEDDSPASYSLLFGDDRLPVDVRLDGATGLPTFPAFMEYLDRALIRATPESPLSVIVVGIDRLRQLTYTLGHDAVDELTDEVAARIKTTLRDGDALARLEFDTLAVACGGADAGAIDAIAARIREAVETPLTARGRDIVMRAGIGIAVSDGTGSREDLVRDADTARSEALRLGGSRVERFVDRLRDRAAQRFEIENDLLEAIVEEQFVLHYQPEVNLRTGDVLGFEALIRWQHPEKGLVLPGHFVPFAEDNGMILKIGAWVMAEACRQSVAWANVRPSAPPFIAVNVSPRQLTLPTIVADLAATAERTGADPARIQLEITESVLVDQPDLVLERIGELHEIGFRIAIDDFGSGYSSLGYLKAFSVDVLKIDRSLVMNIATDAKDWAIVNGVLGMAQAMGLSVVAEGIEDGEQAGALRILGCDIAQGWHFARAAPADEGLRLLTGSLDWQLTPTA